MPSLKVLFALLVLGRARAQAAPAQKSLGAQGAEGQPNRRQQWLVPTPAPETLSHAVLFRPPGEGPFPLAVIAHATTQNVLRRAQMPQPEYRALAGWLVARGFAVLVPERPGHGATGGKYLEDQGGCDEADYLRSGRATGGRDCRCRGLHAQAILHQAGRHGDCRAFRRRLGRAGAGRRGSEDIAAIIVFAAGRGGRANDFPNQICAPHTLIAAAKEFGKGARVPVTWLVAANDTYFSPAFSKQLADAFRAAGGKVDFHALPAFGGEGHWLAETEGGVKLAAPISIAP